MCADEGGPGFYCRQFHFISLSFYEALLCRLYDMHADDSWSSSFVIAPSEASASNWMASKQSRSKKISRCPLLCKHQKLLVQRKRNGSRLWERTNKWFLLLPPPLKSGLYRKSAANLLCLGRRIYLPPMIHSSSCSGWWTYHLNVCWKRIRNFWMGTGCLQY